MILSDKILNESIRELAKDLRSDNEWETAPNGEERIKQLIREVLYHVTPFPYQHTHNHDIQQKNDKYQCLHCGKTVDAITGDDGMGKCPHFRSFNQAIAEMHDKTKDLGL